MKTQAAHSKQGFGPNGNFGRCRRFGIAVLAVCGVLIASASAQQPAFNIVKPSTTGVPMDEVRIMGFDPAGNLWIGGRVIYWGEVWLAMLPTDQRQSPAAGRWIRYRRVEGVVFCHGNPIPSLYLRGLAFGNDGTIWFGSDAGLTRFRPNTSNPADRWFTYHPGNSPLLLDEVRLIAMDSQGNLWIANASLNYAFSYLFKLNTATGQWTQVSSGGAQPLELTVGNNDHVFISMKDIGGIMEFNGNSWAHYDALPP